MMRSVEQHLMTCALGDSEAWRARTDAACTRGGGVRVGGADPCRLACANGNTSTSWQL